MDKRVRLRSSVQSVLISLTMEVDDELVAGNCHDEFVVSATFQLLGECSKRDPHIRKGPLESDPHSRPDLVVEFLRKETDRLSGRKEERAQRY